ncbi:MAG: hypothetical protein OXH10_10440 [bacterium]|nr:hypothetical protein [bacterium]MCY3651471.1 hypothetical protein [bacterium]MDE0644609.1 hypothetical protein [bacterium]
MTNEEMMDMLRNQRSMVEAVDVLLQFNAAVRGDAETTERLLELRAVFEETEPLLRVGTERLLAVLESGKAADWRQPSRQVARREKRARKRHDRASRELRYITERLKREYGLA